MTKIDQIERFVFNRRGVIIALFSVITIVLAGFASRLSLDAGFEKNIPLTHEYMQTYLKYQESFGGANSILVSVCAREGDIYRTSFFETLKQVHDAVFFTNGVNRALVSSVYSPSTRYTEIVEGGFSGGPVIPANFDVSSPSDLQTVKANIKKAGIIGRQVSTEQRCAMVQAQLLELDPETGLPLDTLTLANRLETDIRKPFESDEISIHIIGFSKMIGDVANGAKDVVTFFAVAILITGLLVFLFCRSLAATTLTLLCSLVAVVWQLGLLRVFGFGIDPMSVLVPFLVFAIAVSHAVQMVNGVRSKVDQQCSTRQAAGEAFKKLLLPGGLALLSDTVGFLTLLVIDIGIIRELAITASMGVAVVIFTNLVLLPVALSYIHFQPRTEQSYWQNTSLWAWLANSTKRNNARWIIAVSVLLLLIGVNQAGHLKIGDLDDGAAALRADSRYNQDVEVITSEYEITIDYISIIVEASPEACTDYAVMDEIDTFQWHMENVPGVNGTLSLASVAKVVNAGYNEGNLRWQVLPRERASLVQAVSRIRTSSGLLNGDCSVMPVLLFLTDHKAETIEEVVRAVKAYRERQSSDQISLQLATGPVGVMAATNEAVDDAQTPMLLYVFGVVSLLCWLSFRSVKATLAIVLPLYLVSVLAQALMANLGIGLTVSTLPVIALGVGIGVDYGIYLLSSMAIYLQQGYAIKDAYIQALRERGVAILFTAVTLAIGVSTWVFSTLKFQADMGVLLTFMFLVNMIGAVVLLPAIASLLWSKRVHK